MHQMHPTHKVRVVADGVHQLRGPSPRHDCYVLQSLTRPSGLYLSAVSNVSSGLLRRSLVLSSLVSSSTIRMRVRLPRGWTMRSEAWQVRQGSLNWISSN